MIFIKRLLNILVKMLKPTKITKMLIDFSYIQINILKIKPKVKTIY